jgi:hypothetical protein
LINGSLTVTGRPKSAAVAFPDGKFRRLYCLESPESWFEDFGRVHLKSGEVTVHLDSGFATTVKTDNYHVFLIPENESNGLFVA